LQQSSPSHLHSSSHAVQVRPVLNSHLKDCAKIIKHCHNPDVFYEDVVQRDLAAMSHVDFYSTGFPCQDFSSLGNQRGMASSRGCLMMASLKYIQKHVPKIVMAENVTAFCTRFPVACKMFQVALEQAT